MHRNRTWAGTPHGPRTGKGISKKTHIETLYIILVLILTKPEAAVRASTPGEPLARAAAMVPLRNPHGRMVSPARLQQMLVYRHPVVLVFRYVRLHIVR